MIKNLLIYEVTGALVEHAVNQMFNNFKQVLFFDCKRAKSQSVGWWVSSLLVQSIDSKIEK